MPKKSDASALTHMVPVIGIGVDSQSMLFSMNQLQSSMRISRPDELEIDYTKTMMGFLILKSQPKHIAMIGLGGGSLAKYCYRYLPETEISVVEINPHVISLRRAFLVPEDDYRFRVIEADGADFVRDADSSFDVLLVDGFNDKGQPPQLCSQDFYDNCSRMLGDQGVMAVNLHENHPFYETFIERISQSFDNNFVEVAANHDGNVIVFAGKSISIKPHALRSTIQLVHESWGDGISLISRFTDQLVEA